MSTEVAKSYGGSQIIKVAAVLLIVMEVIHLLEETEGDFANGILFFIHGQTNIYFILFISFSFLTLFQLGRQAGFRIVAKNQNYLRVGILFALISTILITLYITIAILGLNESRSPGYNLTNRAEIGNMIFRIFIGLFLSMLIIWLLVCRQIKVKEVK